MGGYLASLQCEKIGTACVVLGGGRERKEDSVDPTVGIVLHKKVGDTVSAGEPLATIHYMSNARGSCPATARKKAIRLRFASAREKAVDPSCNRTRVIERA